ncbi:BTB/POZ domain-containing protein 17 [Aplysia californica]|uniref:BTB/POZ domain-containing protein 17 n=1 Tax=Aplysia californica TaxID=6500 RepID=A0ABM0JT84_APLCA|nr:BTB/POZ domain-containing protein 17 [Aplysia californica]
MAVPPPDQVCVMGQGMEEEIPSPRCLQHCLSPTSLALRLESEDGIDCYGNERDVLSEQTKFYNNKLLSDVTLLVGTDKFFAHKLVLVRASQVFERMFTCKQWDSHKEKEIKLVEDSMCLSVFPRFLNFLYSCHIRLNIDNTLPVLVLADKYNVADLRNVCLDFACYYIIPKVQLKDVFHVWFQYATKCYHQRLIQACVQALALKMDEIINSAEWETEWMSLDKDQLIEILNSSCLVVKDEFDLWQAVEKWLLAHRDSKQMTVAQFANILGQVMDSTRFPMMTPDQLSQLETSTLVEKHKDLFQQPLLLAYKYHALPLSTRARTKEFTTKSFLLRNYSSLRWDKRMVIPRLSAIQKGSEVSIRFSTRASSFPAQTWEWELKVHPKGSSANQEDFRVLLYSNVILEQPRPVEYYLALVNSQQLLHSVSGRKNFSKARYSSDTEMEKKVSVTELMQPQSPFVVDDSLVLQICLKPAE